MSSKHCPFFASGPTRKPPYRSYTSDVLGRSHRSDVGLALMGDVVGLLRDVLGIPASHKIGLMAGGATGAMESVLWNMMPCAPVTTISYDAFGEIWVDDIENRLGIEIADKRTCLYGDVPSFEGIDDSHDVVFVYTGTTSCSTVGHAFSLPRPSRTGLSICDGTSAVFHMDLPWEDLDVVVFPFQKGLGGEGQHGVVVMSERAVQRLTSFVPPHPVPRIMRYTHNGALIEGIFAGIPLNTPSLMVIEDAHASLSYMQRQGGLAWTTQRVQENYTIVADFIADHEAYLTWFVPHERYRSHVPVGLVPHVSWWHDMDEEQRKERLGVMCKRLAEARMAYDIHSFRSAPAHFRLWSGAYIDGEDIHRLLGALVREIQRFS